MRIGLDIDGTIASDPVFYSNLSRRTSDEGGTIIVISSRPEDRETRQFTENQLREWEIEYERLYLFQPLEEAEKLCPHKELDWQLQYLWQKVHHANKEELDVFYDDDEHVIGLFNMYASKTRIIDAKLI
jgi:hypothetical protein